MIRTFLLCTPQHGNQIRLWHKELMRLAPRLVSETEALQTNGLPIDLQRIQQAASILGTSFDELASGADSTPNERRAQNLSHIPRLLLQAVGHADETLPALLRFGAGLAVLDMARLRDPVVNWREIPADVTALVAPLLADTGILLAELPLLADQDHFVRFAGRVHGPDHLPGGLISILLTSLAPAAYPSVIWLTPLEPRRRRRPRLLLLTIVPALQPELVRIECANTAAHNVYRLLKRTDEDRRQDRAPEDIGWLHRSELLAGESPTAADKAIAGVREVLASLGELEMVPRRPPGQHAGCYRLPAWMREPACNLLVDDLPEHGFSQSVDSTLTR